jgi:3-oxoacyl-ACP reductase-like protein
VRIRGARGDQFFINRESIERYAKELRQIEAVASITAEPRHAAPQHDTARYSAPERATMPEPVAVTPAPALEPERDESAAIISQLRDENLNLRIDNRGKEQAINFITAQAREKDQQLQDMSYRLGAAETRLAPMEAPKVHDNAARQSPLTRS